MQLDVVKFVFDQVVFHSSIKLADQNNIALMRWLYGLVYQSELIDLGLLKRRSDFLPG